MPFNVLCLSATIVAMSFSAIFRIVAPVPLAAELAGESPKNGKESPDQQPADKRPKSSALKKVGASWLFHGSFGILVAAIDRVDVVA